MIDFNTKRLNIVQLKLEDATELFRTVGDAEVMKYWIGGPDRDVAATRNRIMAFFDHWFKHKIGDWGIVEKQTAQLIGFAGLHYINGMSEVNIGYALQKSYWRKGYGFEVCEAVIEYGFKQLGLSQIVAVIWPDNAASINLVKKCGFRYWKEIIWGGSNRVIYKIEKTIAENLT